MAAAPSTPSRWLFGPGVDLLLGCGALYALAIVAFAAAGPSIRAHQAAWVVPVLILLLSMPHYGATLVRVYDRRTDRRAYVLFSVWATLLVAAAFVAGVYDATVASWLFTLYITWSPWHYTGQNYGIAVLFLRRRGVALAPAAQRVLQLSFVLSYALTFLVFHGSLGTLVYSPDASGDGLAFLPLGIPVAATRVLFPAVGLGYAAALVAATALLLRAAPSVRDLVPSACVVLTQALWFSVPFALRYWDLRSGVEPLDAQHLVRDYVFFVALGHAVQYLWVTTYYARASSGWTGYGRYLGKALAAGAAVWTLPVVLFAPDFLGRAEYAAGLALLVAAAVNVHHFILDGVIWKLRQHRIASVLIRAAPADAEAGAASASAWPRRAAWGLAGAGLAISFFVTWTTYFGFPRARLRGDFAVADGLLDAMARLGRDNSLMRLSLGGTLEQAGDAEGALRQYARSARLAPGYRAHVAAGRLLTREGRHEEAARELETASALAPGSAAIAIGASNAWQRAGDPARARAVLEAALARLPDSARLHEALGRLAQQQGDARLAVAELRAALRAEPDRHGTANDLAWILATSADPGVRDPEEAIRLARSALDAAREPDPNRLDTLAAALAAAGRFPEAVRVATEAEGLAAASGGDAMREQIARRLALYRSGRPYVEPADPAAAG